MSVDRGDSGLSMDQYSTLHRLLSVNLDLINELGNYSFDLSIIVSTELDGEIKWISGNVLSGNQVQ